MLNGTWDSKLEASKVIGSGQVKGKSSLEVSDSELLWKAHPPYPGSEAFYNMSKFACELNEEEEGVAPTDSRLRPDQRLMETGKRIEKNRLRKMDAKYLSILHIFYRFILCYDRNIE